MRNLAGPCNLIAGVGFYNPESLSDEKIPAGRRNLIAGVGFYNSESLSDEKIASPEWDFTILGASVMRKSHRRSRILQSRESQ